MNFNTNEASIRVRIVDTIKMFTDSIEEIETRYQSIEHDTAIPFKITTLDNDGARLEKALFLLAFIYPLYSKITQDDSAFNRLIYSTFDMFSNRGIKRSLKSNGFQSTSEFMNSRLNHYFLEIKLLNEMKNPHSGQITNFWYSEPLSASAEFDKDIAHLMFFNSLIWPEYPVAILSACEKIINRFSTE